MAPLPDEEFRRRFSVCKRAFHLELRDSYHVTSEEEPFRKWQAAEHDDHAWRRPWQSFIREQTAAGTLLQRVRVITVPHSAYTRWLLAIAGDNVAAGEDIRYLPRHLAADIDLPKEDYWLFDDHELVFSTFPGDGRAGLFTTTEDPQLIRQCRTARDLTWERSIPHSDYIHTDYMNA